MQIHVLVIDDHPDNAGALLGRLGKYFPTDTSFRSTVVESVAKALEALRTLAEWDALLLDIRDIDNVPGREYTSIPRIRKVHPYIPIVMFSAQGEDETVLTYIDLGARTFIPKSDLPKTEGGIDEQDTEEIGRQAKKVVARIIQVVDEYQPVKRLLARSLENGTVRKSGPRGELEDQIHFLEEVAKDSVLAKFFPRLITGRNGVMEHAAFYEMPFYEMKNLYNFLLSQTDESGCRDLAQRAISLVIEGPFLYLSQQHQVSNLPPEVIRPLFFERFEERVAAAQQKLKAVGDAAEPEARDFLRLLDCRQITLGNLLLRAPRVILHQIASDVELRRRLKPPFLSWIHGDLHFKNILVDDRLPLMMEFKLVDPKGTGLNGHPPGATRYPLGIGDPAYDIGKLLYSSRGMSHLIQDQLFRPPRGSLVFGIGDEEAETGKFEQITSERSSVPEGLSRSRLSVIRPSVQSWVWELFQTLGGHVKKCVEQTEYASRDPDWWLRSCLYEALHFCSLAPMRVDDDPEEAIHLFLRGTELLNQFITDYQAGRFPLPGNTEGA
jgi:CheY-like chemotaxis protein